MTSSAAEEIQPYALLLYPRPDEQAEVEASSVIETLHSIGCIDGALVGDYRGHQQGDYRVGDRFMELVTFLGCSPDICLSPEEGDNYCFIRLHASAGAYRLIAGRNTREPYCKQCRQPQPNWQHVCDENYCDQCTLQDRLQSFNWKKTAALTKSAVEVMNVYPHEAVPSRLLLDSLSEASGVEWAHVYI